MREVQVISARKTIEPIQSKKVAAYCRVSTMQEIQCHSLEAQRSYFEQFIKSNPRWQFAGVYCDQASGRNNKKMKMFQQMLEDCRNEKIDLILVKSISRLGRNTLQFLQAIREFDSLGVDVYFQIEKLHGNDPLAIKMMTVFAALYQHESEAKSFAVKWGHQVRFSNGSSKMFNRPCYGYRQNSSGLLEIDLEQATVVRMIFSCRNAGFSLRKIARLLEETSTPAPHGGAKWSLETIRKILQNEKYYGTVVLGKTFVADFFTGKQIQNHGECPQYCYDDHHEAILQFHILQFYPK